MLQNKVFKDLIQTLRNSESVHTLSCNVLKFRSNIVIIKACYYAFKDVFVKTFIGLAPDHYFVTVQNSPVTSHLELTKQFLNTLQLNIFLFFFYLHI
jgi:hypothetical protein